MNSKLDRLLQAGLYLLVFLLPLFWLPFSFETWEFPKTFLLALASGLALILCLARFLWERAQGKPLGLAFVRLLWPFDPLVLLCLLATTFSAIFSLNQTDSLGGFYGRFSGGLLSLGSLVVVYFFVSRRVGRDAKDKILNLLLASGGLALVLAFLALSGKLSFLRQFSPILGQKTFNPVAPSLEGLAVFLVPLIFLAFELGKRKEGEVKEPLKRPWFKLVFMGLALVFLVIVDYPPAWAVLGLASFIYLALLFFKRWRGDQAISLKSYVLLPFLFLVLAVLGVSLVTSRLVSLPHEVTLDQGTSWEVAGQALRQNFLLGTGPATFPYDFSKFRPASFNQTEFWQIRFDRPGSAWAETLAGLGWLGFLAYFFLAFSALRSELSILNLKFANLFPVLLSLVLGQVFYYQNASLSFLFWLILGVIAGVMAEERVFPRPGLSLDLNRLSHRLGLSLAALALGVITTGLAFVGFRVYWADYLYQEAFYQSDGAAKISLLRQAGVTNPLFAEYQIILARTLANQAQVSIQQGRGVQASREMAESVRAGWQAVTLSPNRVAAWETLGSVYQSAQGLVEGVGEWSVKSFEKAIELEPTNPLFHFRLGQIYFGQNQLDLAEKRFLQANLLKPDYFEPRLFFALVKEKRGETEKALGLINHLALAFPLNADLAFQLGRLEFNQGQVDQSIEQFQTALKLNPGHLDSLYSLALAYEKKVNKKEAIGYLEQALQLSPGNPVLTAKLAELKK